MENCVPIFMPPLCQTPSPSAPSARASGPGCPCCNPAGPRSPGRRCFQPEPFARSPITPRFRSRLGLAGYSNLGFPCGARCCRSSPPQAPRTHFPSLPERLRGSDRAGRLSQEVTLGDPSLRSRARSSAGRGVPRSPWAISQQTARLAVARIVRKLAAFSRPLRLSRMYRRENRYHESIRIVRDGLFVWVCFLFLP